MLGGGERYEFSDSFDSSLSVSLRETAHVWAKTGDAGTPLIWSNDCGSGHTVVCNIGIYDKVMRGFYASAISLLGEATAYPVINSAVFYLDDFPSPVPSGDGTYIKRDYGLSVADFYAKVWWPDLQKLAQKYGIRYTGVMIENYEDAVNQTEPARQADTTQFRYFGGMLLQMGGELGFHGYNHQPLALWDTDYGTLYVYKTWKNKETLVASLNELIAFQDEVLPNAHGSVYVPPSNILSARARQLIGTDVPRIKTIASTYFEDGTDLPYVQEFGVASDGIVEQPRIVSGGMVDDSYMRLAAVSELNMHYVSTHFMHPDDLLGSRSRRYGGLGGLQGRPDRLPGVAYQVCARPASPDRLGMLWCYPALFVGYGERGYKCRCLDAYPGQFLRRGVAHVPRQRRRAGRSHGWRDYASDGRPVPDQGHGQDGNHCAQGG